MNDAVREELAKIVARHGPSVATDARRAEALLRDYAGQHRREIFVLVSAVEEGVTRDLLDGRGVPKGMLLARLAARLTDHLALSEPAARWAVDSWAVALGVVAADELATAASPATPGPPPAAPARSPAAATTRTAETKTAAPTAAAATNRPLVVSAGGGGDFETIGAAIAAAPAGARIVVRPGVYDEGLVLDRRVEISGEGPAERVVVRSAASSCVRMATDEATVRGLSLRCAAGRGPRAFFAVDVPRGRLLLENCDVTSDSLACIGIHGGDARPLVRRCWIHDGADAGVYVFDGGAGTIEACDVFANQNVGVAITSGGDPAVRNCRIFRGSNAGVVSWDGGAGTVDGCDIFGNAQAGVGVSEGGDPVVTNCRIHDGGNSGLFVHEGGRGVFDGCDVSGHGEAEVAITLGGNPLVRRCAIHDGQIGVLVADLGAGLIEECDVTRHARAGVAIGAGASPTLRRCRIRANDGVGIWAREGADGALEECDLTGNALGAWSVDPRSAVRSSGNRE